MTKIRNYSLSVLAIALFFVFAVASGSDDKKTSDSSTTSEQKEETSERKWVEVYTFKGNGMKKSPTFELFGGEARLKYNYASDNEVGMFAAYVVDEGKDIMKQGGIPEVMISVEKEQSESSIQKSAGRYYLNINATGNWTVTVEELK